MLRLMGQDHGPGQEIPEILTNEKNGAPEVRVSPVRKDGPMGI